MSNKKNAACTVSVRQIEKNIDLALGAPQKDIAKYERVVSAFGNVVPVTVVADSGMYKLVDGRARIEACARGGVIDIPVVVAQAADVVDQTKLSLLLSATREQGCPLSEGALIEKLVSEYGCTLGELTKFTGRSKSWLSKRQTTVRSLVPPLKEMILDGTICHRSAEEIAKLPPDEQVIFAAKASRDGLNKDDVCTLIRLYRSPDATLELCRIIIESPSDALSMCARGKSSRKQRGGKSDESRISSAAHMAINLLEEIAGMLVKLDASTLLAAQGSLLKLRQKMMVVGKLIASGVPSDVSPGKREEAHNGN